jgi:hypothetical protein
MSITEVSKLISGAARPPEHRSDGIFFLQRRLIDHCFELYKSPGALDGGRTGKKAPGVWMRWMIKYQSSWAALADMATSHDYDMVGPRGHA